MLKIVAIPRDPNPYQQFLYGELGRLGVEVRYAGEVTGSRSLNLLFLPFELAMRRLAGWRLFHIHWVFGFAFPSGGWPVRAFAQVWYGAILLLCRGIGIRVVWTVHNVLPHQPVFADDMRARRWLVRASALVLAHDAATIEELKRLGMTPARSAIIAHGPMAVDVDPEQLRRPGSGGKPVTVLFLGKILPYKGVEDLLTAVNGLDPDVPLRVVVAGECGDEALRERLVALAGAGRCVSRTDLRLSRVPDEQMTSLMEAADGVVLPYRAVTTSGSVQLALGYGRPVLVPDLPAFRVFDGEAVFRYDGTIEGLRAELTRFAELGQDALAGAGRAAAALAAGNSWTAIASATRTALGDLQPGGPPKPRLLAFRENHLLKGSATLLVNTALLALLGVIFWLCAARIYASSSVGVFSGINSGAALLAMVACLGWPITIVRFLPSERYQRRLVTIMIASVLLLGTATVAIVELVAGPLLFGALHIPRGTTDVILSLILVVVASVGAVTDAALISQRATMVVLVKNFIGGVAKIVALFVFAPLGTTGLVMAATLGGVLAVVLGVGGLWRRIPRSAGHSQGLERGALHYVRYSATGYISSLFGILPMTVVPLVVLGVLGPTPAGWFSMAFLIGGLLAVVPSTAAQVLFAEGSRAPEQLRTNVITAIKAIYGGLAPGALLLFVLAPVIMSLLGPEYEAHATGALRAYAAGSLFLGATYVIDSILMATDRMRAYLMINALNSLLVVALVVIFAGRGLTAVGLAWAAAQGLSVGIGGAILIAPRVYRAGRRRALLPVREPSA